VPRRDRLSLAEVRRIALAAQGFGGAAPPGPERRHFLGVVRRLGLLQIDSVNVLARAHYMPVFSRLGAYAPRLLDEAAWGKRRRRALFEYWGHEASLLPVELQPLLRWRMARAARGEGIYKRLALFAREDPAAVGRALAEIADRGPLSASELGEGGRGKGSWWGWSEGKRALEFLFWAGRVTTATRRGFERVYDLPERVLPEAVVAAPTPDEAEAQRGLLRIAARAHGIATAGDLRDYFRLGPDDALPRIAELVEAGELLQVAVEGWRQPGYLDAGARLPRLVEAHALLSPFDPLIWERSRTARLFGFDYRIEIYTPKEKRKHGYYVLPFLMGDRLVARIDLKADRASSALLARAAHAEADAAPGPVAEALAAELRRMAAWLGLERVVPEGPGDLMPALREALSPGGRGARQGSAARGRAAREA
jgi:uncharacterized protein YcaQ